MPIWPKCCISAILLVEIIRSVALVSMWLICCKCATFFYLSVLTRKALLPILLLYGTLTRVPLFYKARLSFARVPQSRSKDIKVSYSIITFLHFGAKFRRV